MQLLKKQFAGTTVTYDGSTGRLRIDHQDAKVPAFLENEILNDLNTKGFCTYYSRNMAVEEPAQEIFLRHEPGGGKPITVADMEKAIGELETAYSTSEKLYEHAERFTGISTHGFFTNKAEAEEARKNLRRYTLPSNEAVLAAANEAVRELGLHNYHITFGDSMSASVRNVTGKEYQIYENKEAFDRQEPPVATLSTSVGPKPTVALYNESLSHDFINTAVESAVRNHHGQEQPRIREK